MISFLPLGIFLFSWQPDILTLREHKEHLNCKQSWFLESVVKFTHFWRILHHRSCYLISPLLSDFSYFILLFWVLSFKPSPLVYCPNAGKFLSLAYVVLNVVYDSTLLCDAAHPSPPPSLGGWLIQSPTWLTPYSQYFSGAEYCTNDLVSIFENTPLEVRNDYKRSLEDESHRYPHIYKNLQLCKMTKEKLSSRRITTLNPSAESTYDLSTSEKEINSTLKVLVPFRLFVCLFVCLFYKVVNGWKELSSKVPKDYNNQDWSLHWRLVS